MTASDANRPATTTETEPPGPTMRRRRMPRAAMLAVAVVGVAAVVGAILGVAAIRQTSMDPPRALVVDYLEAIAAGDAAAANALAPEAPSGAPAPDSLDGAQPITEVWVGEAVQIDADSASFDVRFDVDGTTVESTVSLQRHETSWLTADWAITSSLAQHAQVLGTAPAAIQLEVAGAPVGLVTDGGVVRWDAALYPGAYAVAASGTEAVDVAADVDALVIGGEGAQALLTTRASDALGDAVEALVADELDDCVATASARLEGELPCGPVFTETPGDVTWSVVEQPMVEPTGDLGIWSATAVVEASVVPVGGGAHVVERLELTASLEAFGDTLDDVEIIQPAAWHDDA